MFKLFSKKQRDRTTEKIDYSSYFLTLFLIGFFTFATIFSFDTILQSFSFLGLAAGIIFLSISLFMLILLISPESTGKSKSSKILFDVGLLILKYGFIVGVLLLIIELLNRISN